jgi:meiotic recombination protein SPO11
VTDQTPEQVQSAIEKVAAEAIDEVLEGNGLRYTLAQRGTGGHSQYVPELDRNYLEYRRMMREFADASQVKKTTMMTRLMQLVREMCVKGIHSTKRDLFYADVKLFEKQGNRHACAKVLSIVPCRACALRASPKIGPQHDFVPDVSRHVWAACQLTTANAFYGAPVECIIIEDVLKAHQPLSRD